MNYIHILLIFIIIYIIYVFFYINISEISHYSNISDSKIDISVVLLIKDNANYIDYMDRQFKKLEKDSNFRFSYYIYENNSKDSSKNKLSKFMQNRNGKLVMEYTKKRANVGAISMDRGKLMADLRNKLKLKHGDLKTDYTILMDTDIVFNNQLLLDMLNIINKNKIVMVTPFTICGSVLTKYKTFHYYDSLAVITKQNISYKETNNTCLYDKCERCKLYRLHRDIYIDKEHMLSRDINVVKSAFGGFCLIRTDIYNKVNWDNTICEHHSFCKKVSNYGNIVVANKARAIMAPDKTKDDDFNKYHSLLEKIYYK